MRVFLTGATGYIGLAAVDAFVRAGHEVAGLVRNQDKARVVASHGARPVIGDMSEPPSYRNEAAGSDGVVHAGWESSARGPTVDRIAIETLLAAVRQPPRGGASATRFFIYTSGVWILGSTSGPAAEDAPANPVAHVAWRPASERLAAGDAGEGVRAMVIRPGIVYGGGRGIVGDLFRDAANGLVRIIGTGENRWATVYERDLADLYVRIASSADAAGVYHACDESDDSVTDIVDAIAGQMAVAPEIRRMPLQEASARLGTYAAALALDQIVRCPRAHALGWAPTLHGVARNVPRLFEEWRNADRAGAGVESSGPAHGTR